VNDPVRTFVAVALAGGVAIALAMPPGAAPDETRHLSRVWVMSEGRFDVPGRREPRATVPKSLSELHRTIQGEDYTRPPRRTIAETAALLDQPIDAARRGRIANAGTYPPLVYAPHWIGVTLGRWLDASPAGLVYLGRFSGLLAWVALAALAIGLAPARRWTLALLSLTPMAVASAAAVSADAMTNAAALLFTALLARAACGDGAIGRRELAPLFAAALFLALVKPGYWALGLGALAIPTARAGGLARRLAIAAGVAAAIAGPSLAWLVLAQQNDPAPPIDGADPAAQLRFVLGDPLGFAAVLLRTLARTAGVYWTTFVGELGPLVVELPGAFYALWALALGVALVTDGPPAPLSRASRLWLGAASAASIALVFAMAYLGWNPVAAPTIAGVQGRYWAPAIPMLVLALPARGAPLPEALRIALPLFAAASLAMAVAAVCGVYYRL
jgi:uncharacterized membrane protein